ncbi:DUF4185 domain-containing protein [Rhodococcus sp. D2-41]|uniref:DUF4185 domain-containing protein n=1 Tax=Speluncibacter jeojiensis TaxID=2710754 RepID=A0A9X4RC05_9ACTN|nr:DUF4185 domain-containing protein [Rhodococcus sp. D2-41]MDG3011857.1 DUF4185 domain-containing protein [Rhodococcus sp. D2-41]MDG3013310.1 DUF4185 domain-containing protein [Corynebacteriales bacterium D3-21]
MSNWGTVITGTPTSTGRFGVGGTDLGIPYLRTHDGSSGYVFGDTFAGDTVGSGNWRSPVLLIQEAFDPTGDTAISFTSGIGGNPATQLLTYTHDADNGHGSEVTRIPNDAIEIDGRTWLTYTAVRDWTAVDDRYGALYAALAYSDDHGRTWTDHAVVWPNDGSDGYGGWSPLMMQSFAGIGNNDDDGHLYIAAKEWGRAHNQNGPILMRVPATSAAILDKARYQHWGYDGSWRWGSPTPTPLFDGMGPIGELSVQNIGGTCCMSYFDVNGYCISTRTAPAIDRVWTGPTQQIHGQAPWWKPGFTAFPQLYGGYIHPASASPTSLTLTVSQWNTARGRPYQVMQFDGINP